MARGRSRRLDRAAELTVIHRLGADRLDVAPGVGQGDPNVRGSDARSRLRGLGRRGHGRAAVRRPARSWCSWSRYGPIRTGGQTLPTGVPLRRSVRRTDLAAGCTTSSTRARWKYGALGGWRDVRARACFRSGFRLASRAVMISVWGVGIFRMASGLCWSRCCRLRGLGGRR